MRMERIGPGSNWTRSLTVRLMRRWVAAREAGEPALPALVALAGELGLSAQAAVALASLFELTESNLGRPLAAECCCSRALHPDELALLLMLAFAPEPSLPAATREIPHGLPGALAWAVASARRLLGEGAPFAWTPPGGTCPFGR